MRGARTQRPTPPRFVVRPRPTPASIADRRGGALGVGGAHVQHVAEVAVPVGDRVGGVHLDARVVKPLVQPREDSQFVVPLDEQGVVRPVEREAGGARGLDEAGGLRGRA